jgi:hypothetical protein
MSATTSVPLSPSSWLEISTPESNTDRMDSAVPGVPQAAQNAQANIGLTVPSFDGDKKKFWVFLRALCIKFMLNPNWYTNDNMKIGFTISKMTEGSAGDWANTQADLFIVGNAGTWEQFEARMVTTFDDQQERATAMAEIRALHQGKDEATVFFTRFEDLASKAEINGPQHEDVLTNYLEFGLHPAIIDRMYS